MKSYRFNCLLVLNILAAFAVDLPAQDTTQKKTAREKFNQVFVKVVVPVTSRIPMQDGPVVESWVAERLERLGVSEYFAVTDWVPVCDGLLSDDIIDNDVWDGRLGGKQIFFHVGGDIPIRNNGRLVVKLNGWLCPVDAEANILLPDQPGSRAVGPVQILVGKDQKPLKTEEMLPYVAVMIAPPSHHKPGTSGSDDD